MTAGKAAQPLNTLPLEDLVSAAPICVAETTPIVEVLSLMERHRISSVLATDRQQQPVGIFTGSDALHLMASNSALADITMAQVMRHPVFTAQGDMDYREAYRLMLNHGHKHLAVMKADGRLFGVVSEADFLHHLGMEYLVELKTVGSAMTTNPPTLPEHASLADAVRLLAQCKQSCLLITRDGAPSGVLTDRDLIRLAQRDIDYARTPLRRVMNAPVLGIAAQMPLQEAVRQMEQAGIRQLAVLSGNNLVGMITRHDVVKAMQGHYIEYLHETIQRHSLDLDWLRQQDARLHLHALNAAGNAIVITDIGAHILWANAAFTRLTGYSLTDAIGRTPSQLVTSGKHDAAFYQHMWHTILAGGIWHGEVVNRRKDGSLYDEELTITPVRLGDESSPISHFIAVKQDITDRKQAEHALQESEKHFRLFYEHAPVAYHACDAAGYILEVNQAWLDQLGYAREQVINRFIGEFMAPNQEELVRARFELFLSESVLRKADYDFLHRDGSIVSVTIDGLVDRDEQGNFLRTQCVMHNITARKQMERELRHLATTDALTGLSNRRHFLDQMGAALARHHRHATPTLLLMIDLDLFKQVNDRYGHGVGDEVLRHCANLMSLSLRSNDLLGRLGGEEFGILLPDTDTSGALDFAERLRRRAAHEVIVTEAGTVTVTLSIGLTAFTLEDHHIDVILARADRALYRAKESGRNLVELEPPPEA